MNHKYSRVGVERADGGKDNEAGTKTGANAEPPMAHGPWRQHFSQECFAISQLKA